MCVLDMQIPGMFKLRHIGTITLSTSVVRVVHVSSLYSVRMRNIVNLIEKGYCTHHAHA